MTPLQAIFAFAGIIFTVLVGISTFLPVIPFVIPTYGVLRLLVIFLALSLMDIWVAVIMANYIFLLHYPQVTLDQWIISVTLTLSGIILSVGMIYLFRFIREAALYRILMG